MAVPVDRRSRSTSNSRSASLTVRLDVGSSRISSRAFIDRARAMATSCCWAVDNRRSGVRGGSSHPDAGQLALGLGVHPPAIEQSQRSAARRLAAEEHVAGDVQRVDELELLVDDRDAEPRGIDRPVHDNRRAVDANLARVGAMDAGQDLHQRRLAGAVLADERHDLPGRQLEVHAVERDDAGKPLGDRRHLQ